MPGQQRLTGERGEGRLGLGSDVRAACGMRGQGGLGVCVRIKGPAGGLLWRKLLPHLCTLAALLI